MTARFYKTFKGESLSWILVAKWSALALPGIAFAVLLLDEFVARQYETFLALQIKTTAILLLLWVGDTIPLTCFGAFLGNSMEALALPIANAMHMPRQLSNQSIVLGIPFSMIVGGLLPAWVCMTEYMIAWNAFWLDGFHDNVGLSLLIYLITMVLCAEMAILGTYVRFRRRNYDWWWHSFCIAGSIGQYFFLVSCVSVQQLKDGKVGTFIVFFSYRAIVSFGLFLVMGFVGVVASLISINAMFGSDRVDPFLL